MIRSSTGEHRTDDQADHESVQHEHDVSDDVHQASLDAPLGMTRTVTGKRSMT